MFLYSRYYRRVAKDESAGRMRRSSGVSRAGREGWEYTWESQLNVSCRSETFFFLSISTVCGLCCIPSFWAAPQPGFMALGRCKSSHPHCFQLWLTSTGFHLWPTFLGFNLPLTVSCQPLPVSSFRRMHTDVSCVFPVCTLCLWIHRSNGGGCGWWDSFCLPDVIHLVSLSSLLSSFLSCLFYVFPPPTSSLLSLPLLFFRFTSRCTCPSVSRRGTAFPSACRQCWGSCSSSCPGWGAPERALLHCGWSWPTSPWRRTSTDWPGPLRPWSPPPAGSHHSCCLRAWWG